MGKFQEISYQDKVDFKPITDPLTQAGKDDFNEIKNKINNNAQLAKKGFGSIVENLVDLKSYIASGLGGRYMITDDITLDENIVLPAGVAIEPNGGIIKGGGNEITFNGTWINAGIEQVFDTNITFAGTPKTAQVFPEWFGVIGDDIGEASNNSDKLQAALDFAEISKCEVILTNRYYYDSTLNINNGQHIKGHGWYQGNDYAKLEMTGNAVAIAIYGDASIRNGGTHPVRGVVFENFNVGGGTIGIHCKWVSQLSFTNIKVGGGSINLVKLEEVWDSMFINMWLDGIEATSGQDVSALYIHYGDYDNCNYLRFVGGGIHTVKPYYSGGVVANTATCLKLVGGSGGNNKNSGISFYDVHFEPANRRNTTFVDSYESWDVLFSHCRFLANYSASVDPKDRDPNVKHFKLGKAFQFKFDHCNLSTSSYTETVSPFFIYNDDIANQTSILLNFNWNHYSSDPTIAFYEKDATVSTDDSLVSIFSTDFTINQRKEVYAEGQYPKSLLGDTKIMDFDIANLQLWQKDSNHQFNIRNEALQTLIQSYGGSGSFEGNFVNFSTLGDGKILIYTLIEALKKLNVNDVVKVTQSDESSAKVQLSTDGGELINVYVDENGFQIQQYNYNNPTYPSGSGVTMLGLDLSGSVPSWYTGLNFSFTGGLISFGSSDLRKYIFTNSYGDLLYSSTYPTDRDTFTTRVKRVELKSAEPASGTWLVGDVAYNSAPALNKVLGWYCMSEGTEGVLGAITANCTSGSATITVNATTGLSVGNFISISGVTFASGDAYARIKSISGLNVELSKASDNTVSSETVSYHNATFQAIGWGMKLSGTTAQRPAANSLPEGTNYFDSDIGKDILTDGTTWKNVDGTAL